MATYFIDKYKRYHDILDANNSMLTLAEGIESELETSYEELKNLSSNISTSNWNELGKNELSSNYMETLNNQIMILINSVKTLKDVLNIAMSETLIKLKTLKEKDEELDKVNEEIRRLGSSPKQYNVFGSVTREYQEYINKLNSLNSLKNSLDESLRSLVVEIDNSIKKIEAFKVEKIEVKVAVKVPENNPKTDDNSKYVKNKQSQNYLLSNSMFVGRNGRMLNYGEYSVVDTPFSVVNFFNYIQKNRVYQDGSDAQNSCFSVAHMYGKSLMLNTTYRGALSQQLHSSAADVLYKDRRLNEPNKQVALAAIYDELMAGRPVSIDVKRKKPGGRHVVTVIGFKTNVKSAAELRSEDLLILDTWDGQIERMDTVNSRVMAAGAEVSQSYKGYRVNRVGEIGLNQVESARQKYGMYV